MVCGIEMIYDRLYIVSGNLNEAYIYGREHNINKRDIVYINTPEMLWGIRDIIVAYAFGWGRHEQANAIADEIRRLKLAKFVTEVYFPDGELRNILSNEAVNTTFSIGNNVQYNIVPEEMFIID